MDMKSQMKMCFFISMICILIHIKFEININHDELLESYGNIISGEKKLVDHDHLVLQSNAKPNK